jgi:hypothetical protein
MNDVRTQEERCYNASVSWVRAYGYDSDADDANHVFFHDFTVPGPPPVGTLGTQTGGHLMAGDQAATVRWVTDGRTSKGKAIYLRKYLHHGYVDSTDPDKVLQVTYRNEVQAAHEAIRTMHGGLRSRTRDLNASVTETSPWVTTRTLKHRGKRGGPV